MASPRAERPLPASVSSACPALARSAVPRTTSTVRAFNTPAPSTRQHMLPVPAFLAYPQRSSPVLISSTNPWRTSSSVSLSTSSQYQPPVHFPSNCLQHPPPVQPPRRSTYPPTMAFIPPPPPFFASPLSISSAHVYTAPVQFPPLLVIVVSPLFACHTFVICHIGLTPHQRLTHVTRNNASTWGTTTFGVQPQCKL